METSDNRNNRVSFVLVPGLRGEDYYEILTTMNYVRIRIVKTPRGEAPENIRDAWVGLEFEAQVENLSTHGVLTKDRLPIAKRYLLLETEALDLLEKAGKSQALKWWRDNGFPEEGSCFAFEADEVIELIPSTA